MAHDPENTATPTFAWMTAPPEYKTRRQLRSAGLSPGGQDIAAYMIRKRRGRELIAHLFDIRKAKPKRTPSPAQLDAIRKATTTHQLRAAERRGLTLADLTQENDPGPAWTASHEKEEITMSDTFTDLDPDSGRTRAALDADTLDDERRFYENALGDLDVDHAEDFAIHMADPTAIAETFVDTRPERAQRLEKSLDRLQAELDQHLHTHQETLLADPIWGPRIAEQETKDTGTQPRLGEATGPGQRLAQLHALMAVNRARYDREQLAGLQRVAERDQRYLEQNDQDPERQESAARSAAALAELREELGQRATRWQGEVPWHRSREALPQVLSDALIWREEDDKSREMVDQLVEHYRSEWGVVVDTDNLTVAVDGQFDPTPVEQFNTAAAVWHREDAALDIVSASAMTADAKDAARQALTEWTSSWATEGGSYTYVETQAQRREQLGQALAGAAIPETDRRRIEFVVDYLRGDTSGVDLFDTPTLVDPGEEVRGRVPQLLEAFTDKRITPATMAEEISVMTPADQEKVRDVGRAIRDGQDPDLAVWPGYVDRDQLLEQLREYTTAADEQRDVADWIAEDDVSGDSPEMLGVEDESAARLERMSQLRAQLDAAAAKTALNGLTAIEKTQLEATLNDIDTGRIQGEQQLPALMWADDRSRAAADTTQRFDIAAQLGRGTRRNISELLASAGVDSDDPGQKPLTASITRVGDAVASVATGPGLAGIDQQRQQYRDNVQALGTELTKAGVDQPTKRQIKDIIDRSARTAGELGSTFTTREQAWKARIGQTATARDDVAAQHRAVASSRAPRSARSNAPRTSRAAQHTPARATGRRQLHEPEIGR